MYVSGNRGICHWRNDPSFTIKIVRSGNNCVLRPESNMSILYKITHGCLLSYMYVKDLANECQGHVNIVM